MAKDTKFVTPKTGARIRFPKQPKTVLPEAGAIVPWIGEEGTFWRRRDRDGSINVYEDREEYNRKTSKASAFVESPIRVQGTNKQSGGK